MSNSPIEQLEFVLQKHQEHYRPERLLEDLINLAKEVNRELISDKEPVAIGALAQKSLESYLNPSLDDRCVDSGFTEFDALTGGFRKGEFVVIGGRPSVGKSKVMVQMCRSMAENKVPCAWFSFDLTSDQLTIKLLSNISKFQEYMVRNGEIKEAQMRVVKEAAEKLGNLPIYIDDSAAQNIFSVWEKCKRLVKQNKVEVVFVDHLQMVNGYGKKYNREAEISLISRELKRMAQELNICVIATSQLSRAVEQRGGSKRPQLSDLRESGAIEQDADKVIFVYRMDMCGITQDENGMSTENLVELILAKNRSGVLGSVNLWFDNAFSGLSAIENTTPGLTIDANRLKELNDDL
jgi:replicative DNA helicase